MGDCRVTGRLGGREGVDGLDGEPDPASAAPVDPSVGWDRLASDAMADITSGRCARRVVKSGKEVRDR